MVLGFYRMLKPIVRTSCISSVAHLSRCCLRVVPLFYFRLFGLPPCAPFSRLALPFFWLVDCPPFRPIPSRYCLTTVGNRFFLMFLRLASFPKNDKPQRIPPLGPVLSCLCAGLFNSCAPFYPLTTPHAHPLTPQRSRFTLCILLLCALQWLAFSSMKCQGLALGSSL